MTSGKEELGKTLICREPEIPPGYFSLWYRHNESPVPSEVWDYVIELAQAEEYTSRAKRGVYGKVPLESLLSLRDEIRKESDPVSRYKVLTRESPNGKIWFDTLVGISSPSIIAALKDRISQNRWHRGLDLGTGSGNASREFLPYCDNLVSLDRANFLLTIARDRLGGTGQYVSADALKLSFSDNSLDFAVASGLTHSLTKSELNQYATELARVLKKGAPYFDAYLFPTEKGIHQDYLPSLSNAKGILADMILDEATGVAFIDAKNRVNFQEFVQIFRQSGFQFQTELDQDHNVLLLEFTK